jgi:hypothetical protein
MLFARAPSFVLARRLVYRCSKTRITPSASAAAGYDEALIGRCELKGLLAGFVVINDRADGNLQNYVTAITAGLIRAFAVPSALSFVLWIEAEMHERVMAFTGFHNDVPALAAVTT